jgi:hypothetical protein
MPRVVKAFAEWGDGIDDDRLESKIFILFTLSFSLADPCCNFMQLMSCNLLSYYTYAIEEAMYNILM